MRVLKKDVLIVGSGPAGASLASFLGFNGVTGLMISKHKHGAAQPRAHLTNMAAFECLRDIGLEREYRGVGDLVKSQYGDFRYCYSLAGPDLVRTTGYTTEPQRYGDYKEASPCEHGDVNQNSGEMVLYKYASTHGFDTRYDCKFIEYTEDDACNVTSTLEDMLTGERFQVVSRFLCGADGARSIVATQAGLQYHRMADLGVALNVWYEADLSHIYKNQPSMLTLCFNPHIDYPLWGTIGGNRMVRPYNEHVMGLVAHPSLKSIDVSEEQVVKRLHELIGDDKVPIKIKGIDHWSMNEAYAETISEGSVFCLGDSISQHSPGKGLGSNSAIQDAYNLAWKLAYVLQGKATRKLLDSYNAERQPMARFVVNAANETIRNMMDLSAALGMMAPTAEERMAALRELSEATPNGAARRVALQKAQRAAWDEKSALGAEMNQGYRSEAIYMDDESDPDAAWPVGTPLTKHVVSTHPGARLPHVWLGVEDPSVKISTHDVAGKGQFTLFTGIGGTDAWTKAAKVTMDVLGNVQINVKTIGFAQEYTDMYFNWAEKRGVEEDGAVLVRPDRTVAWRCMNLSETRPGQKLTTVMKKILGRD